MTINSAGLSQVSSLGNRLHSEDLQEEEDKNERLRLLARLQQAFGHPPTSLSHQHIAIPMNRLNRVAVEPINRPAPYHATKSHLTLEFSSLPLIESLNSPAPLQTAISTTPPDTDKISNNLSIADTNIPTDAASSSLSPEDSKLFEEFIDWSAYDDPSSDNVAGSVPHDAVNTLAPVAHTAHAASPPIASMSSHPAPSIPLITSPATLSSNQDAKAQEAHRGRTRRSEKSTETKKLISLLAEQHSMGVFQPRDTKWIWSKLDAVRECE